jgi:hypothetical protein
MVETSEAPKQAPMKPSLDWPTLDWQTKARLYLKADEKGLPQVGRRRMCASSAWNPEPR